MAHARQELHLIGFFESHEVVLARCSPAPVYGPCQGQAFAKMEYLKHGVYVYVYYSKRTARLDGSSISRKASCVFGEGSEYGLLTARRGDFMRERLGLAERLEAIAAVEADPELVYEIVREEGVYTIAYWDTAPDLSDPDVPILVTILNRDDWGKLGVVDALTGPLSAFKENMEALDVD